TLPCPSSQTASAPSTENIAAPAPPDPPRSACWRQTTSPAPPHVSPHSLPDQTHARAASVPTSRKGPDTGSCPRRRDTLPPRAPPSADRRPPPETRVLASPPRLADTGLRDDSGRLSESSQAACCASIRAGLEIASVTEVRVPSKAPACAAEGIRAPESVPENTPSSRYAASPADRS